MFQHDFILDFSSSCLHCLISSSWRKYRWLLNSIALPLWRREMKWPQEGVQRGERGVNVEEHQGVAACNMYKWDKAERMRTRGRGRGRQVGVHHRSIPKAHRTTAMHKYFTHMHTNTDVLACSVREHSGKIRAERKHRGLETHHSPCISTYWNTDSFHAEGFRGETAMCICRFNTQCDCDVIF